MPASHRPAKLRDRKEKLLLAIGARRELMAHATRDALRPVRPIDDICRMWFGLPVDERRALRRSIPRLLAAFWPRGGWSRRLSVLVAVWRLFQTGRRHARRRAAGV